MRGAVRKEEVFPLGKEGSEEPYREGQLRAKVLQRKCRAFPTHHRMFLGQRPKSEAEGAQ